MFKQFLLLLALFASSTTPQLRTFGIFGYFQANAFDRRIAAANTIHNGIELHCRAVGEQNRIFTNRPNDINGLRRLDTEHRLGFFLHGWEIRNRNNIWMLDVLQKWHASGNINVCVVDWSSLSQGNYRSAVQHVYDVGFTVASVIESLEEIGLFDRSRITLTGYSLGAHAAGFAGQLLDGRVDHIIGLDPAAPMFTVPVDVGTKYRLDESDGRFVQVIHTTGGILGVSVKSGHADFYPNGGVSPQTNCASTFRPSRRIVCSHTTALEYFKFSMDRELPFVGYDCRNYGLFFLGLCRWNVQGRFGVYTDRRRGNFYLVTLGQAPYVMRQPGVG